MQTIPDKYGAIPGYSSQLPESCTIDEAVRYLMYWLDQTSLPIYILPEQPTVEDLEFSKSFEPFSIIEDTLENLEADFLEAKHDELADEVIQQKQAEINRCKLILSKAQSYRRLIIDELAKNDSSALRTDRVATKNHQYPFITILSLIEWALNLENPSEQQEDVAKNTIQSGGRTKMRDQEKTIIDTIEDLDYNPKALPKFIPGKKWVKLEVYKKLANTELFSSRGVFDDAWDRLRGSGDISEIE